LITFEPLDVRKKGSKMKCAPKTTFFPEDQLRRKNPEDELLPEDEFPLKEEV
jgi:hypothetical protein